MLYIVENDSYFFLTFRHIGSTYKCQEIGKNDSPCDRFLERTPVPFLQAHTFQEKLFLLITDFWELFIDSIFKVQTPQKE